MQEFRFFTNFDKFLCINLRNPKIPSVPSLLTTCYDTLLSICSFTYFKMADQSLSNLARRKDAIKSAILELKEFPSLLERSFIPTGDADNCSENAEFRVMQWNALADGESSY